MRLVLLAKVANLFSEKPLANKLLVACLCFYGTALAIPSQAPKQCPARPDIVVAKDKPTVYLTFERIGEYKSLPGRLAAIDPSDREKLKAESSKGIWLRLHNNTRWAISLPTNSLYVGGKQTTPLRLCDGNGALGLRDEIEVDARYEVDVLPGREGVNKPRIANRIDVFSNSWLGPNSSVVFVVPRGYLKDPLAIYLPFHYEWEIVKGGVGSMEPEHRAYFYSWNLPEDVR
jgi:hypothetical protein